MKVLVTLPNGRTTYCVDVRSNNHPKTIGRECLEKVLQKIKGRFFIACRRFISCYLPSSWALSWQSIYTYCLNITTCNQPSINRLTMWLMYCARTSVTQQSQQLIVVMFLSSSIIICFRSRLFSFLHCT